MTLGTQTWSHVVKASCPDVGKLLADEITFSGRDALYDAALAAGVLL